MNVDVKPMKTAAELSLAGVYATAKARLPGGGAVAALRESAFRSFDAQGLPHRRIEEWKYTDLRALMREARTVAAPPDAAAKDRAKVAPCVIGDVECRRIVFINGVFVPELSDLSALEPGLTILSMAEALAKGDVRVTQHLGKVLDNNDAALALNTALMGDGIFIHVAAGAAVDKPLHLSFFGPDTPASVFTRSLVVVEKAGRAMLIESHEGASDADYQVNAAIELVVGDEAHVDHVKLIAEGVKALHVSTLLASIGARARFNDFTFTTGGAVVRNQVFLRFDGADTVAGIRGANLLDGKQHVDTTLVADHHAVGCQSRELFKAVLDGDSHSISRARSSYSPARKKPTPG